MPSVCLYLSMHQPLRLRRFGVFETEDRYFDDQINADVLREVAQHVYEPALGRLLALTRRQEGRFRFTLGLSGVLLEQLRARTPAVAETLTELAKTEAVEFTGEPYYHSLAALFSDDEFRAQAERHAAVIEATFGRRPRVFANTELIYSDEVAERVAAIGGYRAIITEGAEPLLNGHPPNRLYRAGTTDLLVMPRHSRLSDDLAFRFSDTQWDQYPLGAETFAEWIHRSAAAEGGDFCGLYLGLEAFGGRHPAESGIFEFLDRFPAAVLARPNLAFRTLSEAAEACEPADRLETPQTVSWADREHDLSAWLGNAMQRNAVRDLYRLEPHVKACGDPALLEAWRRLTISDHAFYMATKLDTDAAVHRQFSPYASPYDAYINFMNVLDNLRTRADP